jgi:hypothetical protein
VFCFDRHRFAASLDRDRTLTQKIFGTPKRAGGCAAQCAGWFRAFPDVNLLLLLSACDHLSRIWRKIGVPLLFQWNEMGTKALLTVPVGHL